MASILPTTVGSRSVNIALGVWCPDPVSLKKVLNESFATPTVLSEGIWPSGWMPCSRQYNSQQELPICTPAWPTWIDITSLCKTIACNVWNLKILFEMVFHCAFCTQNKRRSAMYRIECVLYVIHGVTRCSSFFDGSMKHGTWNSSQYSNNQKCR